MNMMRTRRAFRASTPDRPTRDHIILSFRLPGSSISRTISIMEKIRTLETPTQYQLKAAVIVPPCIVGKLIIGRLFGK